MKEPTVDTAPLFDEVGEQYDEKLQAGISVSGESKDFFARNRMLWLWQRLGSLSFQPRHIVDFGCGNGDTIPFLRQLPGVERITGIDISRKAIAIAQRLHSDERTRFALFDDFKEEGTADLIYSNGVFHHISPIERPAVMTRLSRILRPGGIFALWENNPWNPGTRYVMHRISFDRDAVPVSVVRAARLLRTAGFRILHKDFLFVFPRQLSWFRRFEPALARFPSGAQYQILCRKDG